MHNLALAASFPVAGLLILTLQILAFDALRTVRELNEGITAAFGHDTNIHPDYQTP